MSIRQFAESISCDRIRFIDEKYDAYNKYMFNKNMKCLNNVPHVSNNKEKVGYLNSININKKSCVDLPYETDYEKELELEGDPYSNKNKVPISFNESTRLKLRGGTTI